jgi:hypothetical protein
MKSRAELLAEIEEKRLESNEIQRSFNTLSLAEPEAGDGYNPYNNPGLCKEPADDADITARRREILKRRRRS